jgi:hypothetical protein
MNAELALRLPWRGKECGHAGDWSSRTLTGRPRACLLKNPEYQMLLMECVGTSERLEVEE